MDTTEVVRWVVLYARIAIGAGFLSAVADRFGLWGAPGKKNVAWGDFAHFIEYTAQVNSFVPSSLAPLLAWLSTAAETVLGVLLIVGLWPVYVAIASGVLLVIFGIAMTISIGVKAPLDYSVFTASAAGFLLALLEMSSRK